MRYQLNRYSIALIVVYFSAFLLMEYGSQSNWGNELIKTLPIILMTIIWSEIVTNRLSYQKKHQLLAAFTEIFLLLHMLLCLPF